MLRLFFYEAHFSNELVLTEKITSNRVKNDGISSEVYWYVCLSNLYFSKVINM